MFGINSPANAPPRGTPVCLMENINENLFFGVVLTKISELAGVIGPYPIPKKIEPKILSSKKSLSIKNNPAQENKSAI